MSVRNLEHMLRMYEFDANVAARKFLTKNQRRSHVEAIDSDTSPWRFGPSMLDDPIVLAWINQGVADPGPAKFDKPVFGL